MHRKSAPIEITFSGSTEYTLTASYVASDEIKTKYVSSGTLYALYTPNASGTGNLELDWYIEQNPFTEDEDPDGDYWSQIGTYLDSSGSNTEVPYTFTSTGGVAGTAQTITPVELRNVNGARFRVWAREDAATAFGTVSFVLTKNNE